MYGGIVCFLYWEEVTNAATQLAALVTLDTTHS